MTPKVPYHTRISARATEMPPFIVMEVLERAVALERAGRSIIHMEVGEPDFDTPPPILEAGIRAVRDGFTHYTHSLGRLELREAIAAWTLRKYGVEVSPDRVIVTVGSSGAMMLTFGALLDPGTEVIMTDPCYACYPNFVRMCGAHSVRLPVNEQDGFQYNVRAVTAHLNERTRAVLLNSPANPTGIVTSRAKLEELVAATHGRVPIISDEIYHGLTYGERACSILEVDPEAIVVSGFSKLFAMTGWRLGWAILPQHLMRPVQKLQQNLFISAPDFAQRAAIAALTDADEDIERMRRCYEERRDLVLRRLAEMDLAPLVSPTGAFYVFVNVSRYTHDVFKFAFEVLEQAGVAFTPGVDFGPHGEGFLRLAYANSLEKLDEGLTRFARFLASRPA